MIHNTNNKKIYLTSLQAKLGNKRHVGCCAEQLLARIVHESSKMRMLSTDQILDNIFVLIKFFLVRCDIQSLQVCGIQHGKLQKRKEMILSKTFLQKSIYLNYLKYIYDGAQC